MVKEQLTFKDYKGNLIQAYKWMPDSNIRAIIQIAHGMAEHAERYEDFAEILVDNGYGVYINDHEGHGKTAVCQEELGHFTENGFNNCVENLFLLTQIIKHDNPGIPVILLGHSMGSHLAQGYITRFGTEIGGCILSGSSGKSMLYKLASIVSSAVVKIQGTNTRSSFMNSLVFGMFNRGFKQSRTDFDWLSRDEEEVDIYVNDPLCGFICTAGFYYEYFKELASLHNNARIKNIPHDLPVYIFSGEKDPVGGYVKGVMKLIKMYKKSGINNIQYKLYPEGRHVMLKETNRDEVINDILKWLEGTVLKSQ
ncbi:MAG: alpha/beta hydrolase [Clostridiaceae bacterium]